LQLKSLPALYGLDTLTFITPEFEFLEDGSGSAEASIYGKTLVVHLTCKLSPGTAGSLKKPSTAKAPFNNLVAGLTA
jgi:hypothetical protein